MKNTSTHPKDLRDEPLSRRLDYLRRRVGNLSRSSTPDNLVFFEYDLLVAVAQKEHLKDLARRHNPQTHEDMIEFTASLIPSKKCTPEGLDDGRGENNMWRVAVADYEKYLKAYDDKLNELKQKFTYKPERDAVIPLPSKAL